ncbi:hypothetical protein LJC71_07615 [Desulfosarcina sp. OttesenSCG-928-A07]|nr:hypothetical protein [Desulfosarcina sp. OttesenSCG-928-G17]MDL2329593.1 hypothetical protein [Desulfosarcina sp. OttesenSCG-928-A07]
MQKHQYIAGDVFLFESDGSCISDLICVLSDSKVSHAALYYEEDSIIEEGLSGIQTRKLGELGERAIHVMKYNIADSEDKVAEKIHSVEQKHYNNKDPYSFGNLIMMGVLLLVKMQRNNMPKPAQALLTLICIQLAQKIDDFVKRKTEKPDTHPMTCSQFAYDCYKEAGYTLQIKRPVKIGKEKDKSILEELLSEGESVGKEEELIPPLDTPTSTDNDGGNIFENLCCTLLEWLKAHPTENKNDLADEKEVLRQARLFAVLLLRISKNRSRRLALAPGELVEATKNLKKIVYDGFVTPGDLLQNCPDLVEKEIIKG